MTTILTPLPPEDFRRTPWKNGGGITIDIADAYLPGVPVGSWQGMIWRFGRTSITVPAPFSDLTGCDRMQIVVVGSGLVLETPTGEVDLRVPFSPVRYDGGTPIVSRLENGPVEVVNLIADRALCAIDLVVAHAGDTVALTAGTHIFYAPSSAVAGSYDSGTIALESGHALRMEASTPVSFTAESGPIAIATIRLRSA